MMPESLLDELEVTAALSGIRVALVMAYQAGQCCELKGAVESLKRTPTAHSPICQCGVCQQTRQQARKTSESSNRTDVPEKVPSLTPSVEQAGSKSVIDFPGRMYDRDWVSQEGD